jgi:hypothetical protein
LLATYIATTATVSGASRVAGSEIDDANRGGSPFQPVDSFGKSEVLHECANVVGHHFEPLMKRRLLL